MRRYHLQHITLDLNIVHDILPLKNQLYRLALRITLNSQEAEDVVQDVIIRLWKQSEQLTDIDNLEAYAMRITRNLAIDRQRMRVNQTEQLTDDMPLMHLHSPSPQQQLEREERIDSIHQTMNSLPEKQRTAMQLRDFEGKSYREIADVMQISEDQVKINIYRARQAVKQKLTSFNASSL